MPELLGQALGSIVRHGFSLVSGFFVARGIWTQDEATNYGIAFAVWSVTQGWSIWQKYKSELNFKAALALPAGASEEQAKEKATVEGSSLLSFIAVLVMSGTLVSGCAGNRAPVLVGQGGLAVAQSVGQLQTAGKQLVDAGVITPQIALSYQKLLLQVNERLKPLPAILDSIDAAQKAGDPTASQLEQALAILKAVSGDLSIVVAGVPLSDATKQVLALVQATQQLVTTLVAQIGQLFPPDKPVPTASLSADFLLTKGYAS